MSLEEFYQEVIEKNHRDNVSTELIDFAIGKNHFFDKPSPSFHNSTTLFSCSVEKMQRMFDTENPSKEGNIRLRRFADEKKKSYYFSYLKKENEKLELSFVAVLCMRLDDFWWALNYDKQGRKEVDKAILKCQLERD